MKAPKQLNRIERWLAGYATVSDLARLSGMHRGTLDNHLRFKRLPPPEIEFDDVKMKYYTPQQTKQHVKNYLKHRGYDFNKCWAAIREIVGSNCRM